MRRTFYAKFGKRALDSSVAALGLLLAAPLMAAIWIALRWTLGPPALFRQQRPGLNGRPFNLLKFRTMTHERGAGGGLLPDDLRLTRLGRFLRASSLDELPQLVNILRGEMSLVGPRPLLTKYLRLYTAEQMRRHEALPGITGLAQISGRNALPWEERFKLDVWYVDHLSLALDLKVLLGTIRRALSGSGVSQPGRATADEFRGGEDGR